VRTIGRPAPEAIGVALLCLIFIAISVWWVLTDLRPPGGDESRHIALSFGFLDQMNQGHQLYWYRFEPGDGPFYPPLVAFMGMLYAAIGGKSIDALQIGENLVFVPLFAVATYRVGTIAFNRLAGLLAVAFALGTPMMISQFHMYMLDMPLAAMVAAGVWLLLETERFERRWLCVLAGVALGLGLMTKQSYPFFLLPFVAVMILRGGWRRPLGLALVAVPALVVAGPWYIDHWDRLRGVATEATAQVDNPWGSEAPRFSLTNYTWYGWNLINVQLLLPLTLLFLAGTVGAAVAWVRERDGYAPELIAGALGSFALTALWFGYHDPRYSFPAIVYMAVLGAGWLTRRHGRVRLALIGAFALVVVLNTITVNLGVLGQHAIKVPGGHPTSVAQEYRLTVQTNYGYVVGKPERAGDLPAIMRAAKRDGITKVAFESSGSLWMDPAGLSLFATDARLGQTAHPERLGRNGIYFTETIPAPPTPKPCARLPDGGGVYIYRGTPQRLDPRGARNLYCPARRAG
jgi:4-amino-4-deoxy-L-arabinose transferase-like glycosyltransferase